MTHGELKVAFAEMYRQELFKLFYRPKETVDLLVESLVRTALNPAGHYTRDEVLGLLAHIPQDEDGRLSFQEIQRAVLDDFRRRMTALVDGKEIIEDKKRPIPYQSKAAAILDQLARKKKLLPNEEFQAVTKRLHAYAGLIAPLDEQSNSSALSLNIRIMRDPPPVNDRWDRYCCVRHTNKGSHVKKHAPVTDI